MKRLNLSTNIIIFLLFFGVALLEAIKEGNWIKSVLWAAVGIVFLLADNIKRDGGGQGSEK